MEPPGWGWRPAPGSPGERAGEKRGRTVGQGHPLAMGRPPAATKKGLGGACGAPTPPPTISGVM